MQMVPRSQQMKLTLSKDRYLCLTKSPIMLVLQSEYCCLTFGPGTLHAVGKTVDHLEWYIRKEL